MASSQALPEPMNSQPHHSKVKITITLPDPTFVAGAHVSGKLEMECRADRGLGIGIMMVELFAIQELSSRDHSATSTFLHSRRLFQGPGLPPSNAVQAHPMPGDPPLPQHYHQARKGRSTFLFRIPIPASSPSTIAFGSGLAKVHYELRASVGVFWKNEKRLVIDKTPIDVVEAYPYDDVFIGKVPEAIVVGENGKLWMQGKIVGNVILAGDSACLELQVKNHSNKKNSGLTLSLVRTLYLPSSTASHRQAPVQISDTLTTVPYRGPEYIIPPGAEGVANLVFDVPKHARGARGGTLDGEEAEDGSGPRHTDSLFEVKCKVEVKLTMGMGSKDIVLEVPVEIVHPSALPSQPPIPGPYAQQPYTTPQDMVLNSAPYADHNPYYPIHPMSPAPPPHIPYVDPLQNQVWMPPPPPQLIPLPQAPLGYPYYPYPHHLPGAPEGYQSPYTEQQPYHEHYISPHPQNLFETIPNIPRPSSVGAVVSASQVAQPTIAGLPPPPAATSLIPLHALHHPHPHPVFPAEGAAGGAANHRVEAETQFETELGKGDRALRVSRHLRISSRNRSVSPQSHRYPQSGPGLLGSVAESKRLDSSSHGADAGPPQQRYPRSLPPPPPLLLNSNAGPASSPDGIGTNMVHSPRPQLTPKHSFTREPVLVGGAGGGVGVMTITKSKSERVEELEKMADEVAKKSLDLSHDLPKGISGILASTSSSSKEQSEDQGNTQAGPSLGAGAGAGDVNKTLPGPPVPSGKNFLPSAPLPGRLRADLYFAEQQNEASIPAETAPLPSDQTPPTPALLAVHPSRSSNMYAHMQMQMNTQSRQNRNDLRTESGLDALERRLLAEVGTRKIMDAQRHGVAKDKSKDKDKRPDVRDVLSAVEDGASSTNRTRTSSVSMSMSIPATAKSPETLHDSAISSLTLAGGLGGDESDGEREQEQEQEFDGRTHRAGKSRAGSADDEDEDDNDNDERGALTSGGGGAAAAAGGGLHYHMSMRERTQVVSTPTRTLNLERVRSGGGGGGQRDQDSREDVDSGKSREGRSSGKKKDRSGKSAAKGRVAAWLGRIDPDVPPQEQIIPPSPSVSQTPASPFHVGVDVPVEQLEGLPVFTADEAPTEVSAPPNPRSSGFVPIATLKKDTLPTRPLIAKDATVVEEARRVQDIWASANEDTPMISAQAMPRFFKALQPGAAGPMSIRTDRRVSPPSSPAKPAPPDPRSKPLSYSAVTKNVWKAPEMAAKPVVPPVPPPKTPISPPPKKVVQAQQGVGRVAAVFPPPKLIDPEVKYDIRSARGGRGGKVTAVANLWASGAVNNNIHNNEQAKGKIASRSGNVDGNVSAAPAPVPSQSQSPPPPLPPRAGKKLFSDAVLTPALPPKRTSAAAASASAGNVANVNVPRPSDAQKRPDARAAFFSDPKSPSTSTKTVGSSGNAIHHPAPGPKKVQSATPLVPPPSTTNKLGVGVGKGSQSTDALVLQKRPATAMSSSSRAHGKTTPTSLSTPSSSQAADPHHNHHNPNKLHNLVANMNLKGVHNGNANNLNANHKPKPKPKQPVMYKGTSDPAVVSSSHAVPMLSSTASLARPHPAVAPAHKNHPSPAVKFPPNANAVVPSKVSSGLGLGFGNGLGVHVSTDKDKGLKDVGAQGPQMARPASPSKPVVDLAFGQARIRDLIKKYQGGGGGAGGGQVGQRT